MNASKNKKRKGTDTLPFKDILKRIKNERNLSVRALAAMAEVGESVAQSWLNGAVPHDLQAVARLAKGLGLSFRELLLGEDETNVRAVNVTDLFEESDLFEGICKVSIKKLTPRKGEK